LENHHYKAIVAHDGKEALDKLSKHMPALVISDIMMPEMNGYELCKEIKSNKNTGNIPVILLTALSDTEEIIKELSYGADSFISKPCNEEYLISQIKKNLSEETGTDQEKVPFSTQILFKGKKRYIQAAQQKVIKLLVNIYEGAIQQNEKLIQTRDELRLLNEKLESIVEDRTSDLSKEIKRSNQITERLRESEEKWQRDSLKKRLSGKAISNSFLMNGKSFTGRNLKSVSVHKRINHLNIQHLVTIMN
jgi:response regulator RpfG family c-di-GMP phosphodiesterase